LNSFKPCRPVLCQGPTLQRPLSLYSSTSFRTCHQPPLSTRVHCHLKAPPRRTASTPLCVASWLGKLCHLVPLPGVLPLTPSCSFYRSRHLLATKPPPPAVPVVGTMIVTGARMPRNHWHGPLWSWATPMWSPAHGAVTLGPIRPVL
jgi:hypothetical protein